MPYLRLILLSLAPLLVRAHVAAYAKGMYCLGGPDGTNDNNEVVIYPLWNKKFNEWWFQGERGCDKAPPKNGDILELPAGGTFDVELAHNQAFTTLSWGGSKATNWPDGQNHPDGWGNESADCMSDGALHTFNETAAAGTAFAISYQSEQSKVAVDNLVVFTTKSGTPYRRQTTYEVPAAMPPCPNGVCHCMWLWVASQCGQQNIYVQPFKCKVTGSTSNVPVAKPKPPTYCVGPGATEACVAGAKQPVILNQKEGNNVKDLPQPTWGDVYGYGYTVGFGYQQGAQNDIFETSANAAVQGATTNNGASNTASTKQVTSKNRKVKSTSVKIQTMVRAVSNSVPASTQQSAALKQKPVKCQRQQRGKH